MKKRDESFMYYKEIQAASCDEKYIDIHIHCRHSSALYSRSYNALVYRHFNVIKEIMKFSSLPEGRLIINSKTGQMSSDPKNR